MIVYRVPAQVRPVYACDRPLLTTPQGGRIALDARLLALWQEAGDRELEEIVTRFAAEGIAPAAVRAALACLAEAGLLRREGWERPHPVVTAPPRGGGLVSAIVVGYDSRHWLELCLPSLLAQTYTPIEIVVVDNGSRDGTEDWLAATHPRVTLLRLERPRSLASALNQGAALARGSFLLLLNPDVVLAADAVGQMVAVAQSDPSCGAVAAKLKFSWAPAFLNGIGNRVGETSWGSDNGIGHLDLGQFDDWREVPSACFAATLIPRAAWETAGPVDEGFPLYYEDTEWCYRARLLGFTVRAAPRAVGYHAFGSQQPGDGRPDTLAPQKLRNAAYGRLRFVTKLGQGGSLRRWIRNYAREDALNWALALARRDWPTGRAYLDAWRRYVRELPALLRERKALQARRAHRADILSTTFAEMPEASIWQGLPELTWDRVLHQYLPLFRTGRTGPMPEFEKQPARPHLLIVSQDVIDARMAGPGMRYLEMARVLSGDLDVTVAIPAETTLQEPDVRLVRYWEDRPGSLQVLVENADIALVSGYMVDKFPFLRGSRTRLVVDLYDPFILENLHYYVNDSLQAQESFHHHALDVTNCLARIGDFFICGSERQRDFWIGLLTANGRINPRTFAQDAGVRTLIDVVGIGFPDRAPRHRPILRGVHSAFPAESRIVLWGGGIWNWLDPLTLVRAWPEVAARHPEARLVFLGTRHPNPSVPRHRVAEEAEALAAELGEKDRTIFFYDWLPYEEREALLCEADIGVTLHPLHVETRYSIRTRVLDYLWAKLPVLITEGDVTSEWVRHYGLGYVVPPHDSAAVTGALCEMLARSRESWSSAFEPLREQFSWPRVVEPLRRYCLQGGYAPDRLVRTATLPAESPIGVWRGRLARGLHLLRGGNTRAFLREVRRYLQWRLAHL